MKKLGNYLKLLLQRSKNPQFLSEEKMIFWWEPEICSENYPPKLGLRCKKSRKRFEGNNAIFNRNITY